MKKRKLIYFIIILVLVLCIGFIIYISFKCKNKNENQQTELTVEELVENLRKSSVSVTVGKKHASGVIADINDEEVVVLTAGHLMDGYTQGIITFCTGNVAFGDVKYIALNPDLCIMSFDRALIDESLISQLSDAKVDITQYEKLNANSETVYLIGSVFATGSNIVEGRVAAKDFYVEDFDARMLYLYTNVMAGMSGCGVYDRYGYLVGILAGGTEGGDEAVCVALPDIIEKWEEIKNDKD